MSKKNRRKTLSKKEPILPTGEFTADSSKVYLAATIMMFHILPLVFIAFGDTGKGMLGYLYVTANPIFLSVTGLIYGLKKGFNAKFPLIMAALAILSIFMYGSFSSSSQGLSTTVILTIVYLLFSFASVIIGSFLKKLFRL